MSDYSDYEFEEVDSKDSFPKQCSSLGITDFVMLKGRPCRIVEMSTSKTGKHGNAKVHLVGTDLFTGERLEDTFPTTHIIDVPVVKWVQYQFVSFEDGYVQLMDDNGDTRRDLKLPDDLRNEILEKQHENFLVTVLKAVGQEAPISVQEMSQ